MSLSLSSGATSKGPRKQSGFTLIELMVVMAIIAILATAGVSAYMNYIDKARVTKVGEFARNVNTGLADKLILKLDFDEGNMTDASGYNHNGTCTNCPASDVGWNGGGAYRFDGEAANSLYLGKGTDFFPMPTFTICAWVKTPGLTVSNTSQGIISVTYRLMLYINSTGQLASYLSSTTESNYKAISGNLNDNRFHYVCVTYDGAQRHLYIDGVKKSSDIVAWTGQTAYQNSDVRIGVDTNDTAKRKFNGIIDDVRFYSSSLLVGDIEKMYREGTWKYLAQK